VKEYVKIQKSKSIGFGIVILVLILLYFTFSGLGDSDNLPRLGPSQCEVNQAMVFNKPLSQTGAHLRSDASDSLT
jgi:hypothetical protein